MRDKTVFIIGAGASCEVNLPVGAALKNEIASSLEFLSNFGISQTGRGDREIIHALKLIVEKEDGTNELLDQYIRDASHISDAIPLSISIDNFIDTHRDKKGIAICGKLAIVKSILKAEGNSLLFFKKIASFYGFFEQLRDTWYISFFQLLTENCTFNELKERLRSIILIIFNYDRCVEHFLFWALKNYYRRPDNELAEIMKEIKIFHPYGYVGALPYMGGKVIMDFGASPQLDKLIKLSQKIRTFTEGTDPEQSEITAIHESINKAGRLVFLGFAFHRLNMNLLRPKWSEIEKADMVSRPICFATAHSISQNDINVVIDQIRSLYLHDNAPLNINIGNYKCNDLFAEFWRSLSF
jgi:hypothetical protein